jgi:hypothetical protein
VVSQVSGSLLYAVDGPVPNGEFGHRVIGLDDRNNDGRAEFAASSPWAKIPGVGPAAGRVDILDGASGLTTTALQGTQKFSLFGAALSALPDQSGDGLMELLIGSPRFDLPGLEDAGRLEIETGTGFTWADRNGEAAGELYGSDAIWPGDLDGDGIADLVVSAPMAPGAAGLRAGRIQALSGPLYDTVIWNREGSEANAAFGMRIEPLDDQNMNQFPDFLVHSPLRNGNALTNSGSVQLIEGQTGTTIWDLEGSQPGGRLGTGMAGGRDFNGDGRKDALVATPYRLSPSGHDNAGCVQALSVPTELGFLTRSYNVGNSPAAVKAIDMDGDSDLDLVVLIAGNTTVRVLWNGGHGPPLGPGIFDLSPPTSVSLPQGSELRSLDALDLFLDGVPEIVVGTASGEIHIIQGLNLGGIPTFNFIATNIPATGTGPLGAIVGLGLVRNVLGTHLLVASQGSIFYGGQLLRIEDPFGSAIPHTLTPAGGSFAAMSLSDLDQDGLLECLAVRNGAALGGFLLVLSGNDFSTVQTSTTLVVPTSVTATSLDGDALTNDVAVTGVGLPGAAPDLFLNWSPGGFASRTTFGQAAGALSSAAYSGGSGGPSVLLLNAEGRIVTLSSWSGQHFGSSVTLQSQSDIHALHTAPLRHMGPANLPSSALSLVGVQRALGRVVVMNQAISHRLQAIPNTGCAVGGLTMTFTGRPVLGDPSFAIRAVGGPPNSNGFLLVHFPSAPLIPAVTTGGGCGLMLLGPQWILVSTTLNSNGSGVLPLPVPQIPALLLVEYGVQWIMPAASPGVYELSEGWLLRFGEY